MTKLVTRTGRTIDLVHPEPGMFCAQDVAWALAHEVRWNGCLGALSVAQHSCEVAEMLRAEPPLVRLQALLHDASEAYLGDVASPAKAAMARIANQREEDSDYAMLEARIENVIYTALAGGPPSAAAAELIGRADATCARVEAVRFGHTNWKDAIRAVAPEYLTIETFGIYSEGTIWGGFYASEHFLRAYDELKAAIDQG